MRTPRNPAVAGRLGAVLFMVSGAVTLLSPFVPAHPDIDRLGVFLVGVAAVAGGALIWAIPWGRLPARAQWTLMLLAHGLIALHNQFGGNDPFRYGLFFLVSFAWVGMTQRRFTSLVFLPSFLAAYLTPLLVGHAPAWEISSVLYAAPVCILVAEALSWTGDRLEASQNEVLRREERFRSLVQNSMDVVAVVDAEGRITYISPSVEAVLGWRPDEVIGRPARTLVYESDREKAEEEGGSPVEPGVVHVYEVRAARRLGGFRWVQVRVTNLLEDPAVAGLVCNFSDISERREMTERLRYFAYNDPLTGLPNRVAFLERLEQAVARARRHETSLAVLFIDLDEFKEVNDSFGHAAGDTLLHAVAGRLRSCTRPEDTLARLGGDEFTVLIEDLDRPDQAEAAARRLLDRIASPFLLGGRPVELACSIGIAQGRRGDEEPDELLRRADVAMYRAKSGGRNQLATFAPDVADSAPISVELA
ncbi:MAG: diguanylate cyclase [Actinobacteria bacterium]|nr:MAG: diguanylate cyclase [Actinomycetota bacterium]